MNDNLDPQSDSANQEREPMMENPTVTMAGLKPFSNEQDSDPNLWLQKFKTFAKVKKLADDIIVPQFSLLLTGKAERCFSTLPEDRTTTFAELEKTFLEMFTPSEAIRWSQVQALMSRVQALMSRQQGASETSDDFIEDVRRQAGLLKKDDKEVVDFIVNGLRPEIRSFVLSKEASNLRDVTKFARMGQSLHPHENSQATLQSIVASLGRMEARLDNVQQEVTKVQVNAIQQTESRMNNYHHRDGSHQDKQRQQFTYGQNQQLSGRQDNRSSHWKNQG